MNGFDSILDAFAQVTPGPEDYTGEGGLLYCGKCHTSKQFRMDKPPLGGRLLPHPCRCEQERIDREAAEQEAHRHHQAVTDLRRRGFTDPATGFGHISAKPAQRQWWIKSSVCSVRKSAR